ncbi:hypothetical protein AYO44_05250 [Planctomycetaceae bacterium SCGC AG-212-F19]|nr:hypothetical protein AYO44_05250 [Planctomycetaceae bacterium SCGC AG-212-F19]
MIRASALVFAVILWLAEPAHADFIAPFDLANVSSNNGVFSNSTRGYSFTLTDPITVGALGYYDNTLENGTGLTQSHLVSLWDSLGNLLGSATVLPTDTLLGHFRYHDLTQDNATFTLAAGPTYIVGGYTNTGADYAATSATIVAQDPRVQNIVLLQHIGQNPPSFTASSFVGTFGINSPSAVPEPTSLALLGTVAATVSLALVKHYRRRFPSAQEMAAP